MNARSAISFTLPPPSRKEREFVQPIAAIFDTCVIYRYSLVLALSCAAGICFFMACCSYAAIPARRAATTALTALLLSLPLARLVYWYGRPDSFSSLAHALTTPSAEAFALAGAFAGCLLSVIVFGGQGNRKTMLDCMSIAGSFSLALGRLACFFTASDRGQIMTRLTGLPWAYPVSDSVGHLEYRFATFLFQALFAAALAILLTVVFLRKKTEQGDVSLIFLLFYSASQFLLDSTRYDSLYLRNNGFVRIVQILSSVTLLIVLLLLEQSVLTCAAESILTYRGFAQGFDIQPGSGYSETDLFDDFKDVMPGDVLTEEITIKNNASDCDYINLYII